MRRDARLAVELLKRVKIDIVRYTWFKGPVASPPILKPRFFESQSSLMNRQEEARMALVNAARYPVPHRVRGEWIVSARFTTTHSSVGDPHTASGSHAGSTYQNVFDVLSVGDDNGEIFFSKICQPTGDRYSPNGAFSFDIGVEPFGEPELATDEQLAPRAAIEADDVVDIEHSHVALSWRELLVKAVSR